MGIASATHLRQRSSTPPAGRRACTMASVSGVADVGSSFFNLSGTLSTYEDLARSNAVPNIFQGSLPARADPEERPQKKRRLDDGTSVSFQSQGVFDVNQSIVLAKVSLVLVGLPPRPPSLSLSSSSVFPTTSSNCSTHQKCRMIPFYYRSKRLTE